MIKNLEKNWLKKWLMHFFADRLLKTALNNTLQSHHIILAKSKLAIKPKYSEIEIKCNREMATFYPRTKYQKTF